NRRAAKQARAILLQRLARSLPALHVHTAHSFAFGVLGARFTELGYAEPPKVLSAAEHYATVRELMLNDKPSRWPRFGSLLGDRADVGGRRCRSRRTRVRVSGRVSRAVAPHRRGARGRDDRARRRAPTGGRRTERARRSGLPGAV